MNGFILGQKGQSEQMFDESQKRIPVTHIWVSECYLIDLTDHQKNGSWSVRIGFGKTKTVNKPQDGILKKAGIKAPLRFLREFRVEEEVILKKDRTGIKIGDSEFYTGDLMRPELIFKKGETLMISGISKGKGFAGVVKRHHFAGGPRTHGQSDRERAPGSIGQSTTPGRVYKGKRMAGRMGGERVTIKNLKIIDINPEEIIVKGLIPGAEGGLLLIKN